MESKIVKPDRTFIREVRRLGGDTLKKCYQCATCSTVCELSHDSQPFPRREMIMAGWGQTEDLIRDPNIWLCHQCNDCTTYCPRGARPGDVLAAIRSYAYETIPFPSFMGRALAQPKLLPALLIVPLIILMGSIFLFAPHAADGSYLFLNAGMIDFNLFLPHRFVDALFVIGNILIFIFASIGFRRFWNGLQRPGIQPKSSFAGALVATLGEVFSHRKFRQCGTNRPRTTGHLLLFYGFLGAMVTTGAIFVSIFIPHYLGALGLEVLHPYFELPLNLPNPIKILGAASGLALLVGGGLLIIRRWRKRDEVGANGYSDYLFLYVLVFAGLSGVVAWLMRWAGVGIVAYPSYFLHLVAVFFLLWYMPYSKFAHMIYRTLALVHVRRIEPAGEQ
jgi:quinone-modifying oxidoreductase, subunit QmoC